MDEKQIKDLIKKGESRSLEFKESLSLKNKIGEGVSAFANTCGGVILIGISDSGEVKGVQLGKKTIEGLANYIKQNTDNNVYPDISVKKIDEKDIIIIKVNESDEKPVFFRGKAYKRVGKSNHKLSASEIRKLAKESGKKVYWDEQVCEDAGLDDIEFTNKSYREHFKVSNWTCVSDMKLLMKLSFVVSRGVGKSLIYTISSPHETSKNLTKNLTKRRGAKHVPK